jgi:hypothetical protein
MPGASDDQAPVDLLHPRLSPSAVAHPRDLLPLPDGPLAGVLPMTTAPLRDFVARPDEDARIPVSRVHIATRDALEAAKGHPRAELMMTADDADTVHGWDASYRAWIRGRVESLDGPTRLMGRPADSAEGAALALLAKLRGTR